MKKRGQHYIWRKYLKPWCKDDKIWCLRTGRIFQTDLTNVGKERDFYRQNELSETEISFVSDVAIKNSPTALHVVHQNFLDLYIAPQRLKVRLKNERISDPQIDSLLDEFINNAEEDYLAKIEGGAIIFLDNILKHDVSFYESEAERNKFLYYLAIQYMRTKRMKDGVINATNYQTKINIGHMWNLLKHIYATNLAYNVTMRNEFKCLLLENRTTDSFITGDQPVINTYHDPSKLDAPPKELELYYPISPKLALLVTMKQYHNTIINDSQSDLIKQFNLCIQQQAHEQLYSDSKEALQEFNSNTH